MSDPSRDAEAEPGRPGTEPPAGRRRRFGLGRRRMLHGAAWGSAGVILLSAAGFGLAYTKLDGNIAGIDIDAALGRDRPENIPNGSLDILVLGSDSRSGDNARYGGNEGKPRSDTAMVVHIHKGQRRASVVSIPRDTLVARPGCERTDGGTAPPRRREMFNAAYSIGGPACTVKTVEAMTRVRMDHFLEVDFSGFKKLIDHLGGVEVTTTEAIKDKDARLDLPPGTHILDGEQSLGLVRTRKGTGDGSDLGRIQLQQKFIRALAERIDEIGVSSSPKRLYELADTATSAVTTDSALASVGELVSLGKALRRIEPQDLQMVTLPVAYDSRQPGRVVPLEEQTARVWGALRKDRAIPTSALEDTAGERAESGDVVE